MTEIEARIPLGDFPALAAEVEAVLRDPERLGTLTTKPDGRKAVRKALERIRRDGLPMQLRPFVRDPRLARALLADVEKQAA